MIGQEKGVNMANVRRLIIKALHKSHSLPPGKAFHIPCSGRGEQARVHQLVSEELRHYKTISPDAAAMLHIEKTRIEGQRYVTIRKIHEKTILEEA